MDRTAKDAELLLSHSEWVRRLAHSLVADSNRADDLVQRTWVAALEHPPGEHVPLRAWFAGVLRNLARQDRRADDRRVARERAAAREDVLPSADESLDAIARQKMLMGAVLDLDEPYRSVIVRRYFDDVPPRDIASELGLPVKTVKTRLARALEKLRERLDREHGSDRGAWMALFVPWIQTHGPAAAGGLLMNAKIKAAIALAIAAGTIAAVVHFTSLDTPTAESDATSLAAASTLEAPEPISKPELVEEATSPVERTAVSAPTQTETPAPAPVPPAKSVRGRVIDITGAPVASIDVFGSNSVPPSFRDKPALARTGPTGEFEFVDSKNVFQLSAENDAWTTVLHPRLEASHHERRALIVVGPRITVAGRVLDESRRPIVGADVWTSIDDKLRASMGAILDTSSGTSRDARTDAEGRFELGDLPACPGRLTVRSSGYALESIEMPDHTTLDLEIVMKHPENPHVIVRGIVLEPDGRPADGALVSHGAAIETTGPDGRFEFDFALAIGGDIAGKNEANEWMPKSDYSKIHAIKSGFAPAREDLPDRASLQALSKPFDITLMLGAKPLSIRGRVVDAHDKPVAGALVWIKDGTPFGSFVQKEGDVMMAQNVTVEEAFRSQMHTPEVTADAEGRFEIDNVLDREYVLIAVDPNSASFGRREHATPGDAPIAIVIPDDPSVQRVAGRVVSHSGRAIAGVHVRLGRRSDSDTPTQWRLSRVSDKDGRFDFGSVAADGLRFQLTSKAIAFVFDYEVPRDSKFAELELPVSLQCHVQADLGERKDIADYFAVLDKDGNELTMLCWRGSMALVEQRPFIRDGRSEVLAVEEIGTEVVFYKGEVEMTRVPIVLQPGELVTVRP
jgi:RNA polymerase sigma-70 factor (ECF subfamily)